MDVRQIDAGIRILARDDGTVVGEGFGRSTDGNLAGHTARLDGGELVARECGGRGERPAGSCKSEEGIGFAPPASSRDRAESKHYDDVLVLD